MMPHNQEPQVLITRLIHAPRALVFSAWTDPAQLMRWHAPNGCTITYKKLELRTGGSFHSVLVTPGGKSCCCVGRYHEIVAPERIVYSIVIADENGNRQDPVAAGMDARWPAETLVTVTFEEANGKTKLTLRQSVSEALAKHTGAHPSWLIMFDRLDELLHERVRSLESEVRS